MDLLGISIKQFKRRVSGRAHSYGNEIFITDRVEQLGYFQRPCRLDAEVVLICLSGELDFSVNLKRYTMRQDSVAVCFAGDIVQIHRVEALKAYAVLLSSAYLEELKLDFRSRSLFFLNIHRQPLVSVPHAEIQAFAPYYTLMEHNMEFYPDENPEILRSLVRAFTYSLIALMQRHSREAKSSDKPIPRNQLLFDKFMSLLKVYHATEHQAKFYANTLCLTPNYLSGVIKAYSGKSVSEWINEYVVTEAKILLCNTDLSVQEIAYRLNFATQSAFGKYFKLQTGLGPRAYRRQAH